MFLCRLVAFVALLSFLHPVVSAQAPTRGDVYMVSFFKATPGQGSALANRLQQQNPGEPTRTFLLANAQGADWDFALIQHFGRAATVTASSARPSTPNPNPVQASHSDSFVSGPPWEAFSEMMGTSGVYVVGTYTSVPGARSELLRVLRYAKPSPNANRVVFEHIDGETWTDLTVERFTSWQDYAAARTAAPVQGQWWNDIRQRAESHEETLAERAR